MRWLVAIPALVVWWIARTLAEIFWLLGTGCSKLSTWIVKDLAKLKEGE
ncbi:MAG: hypothetical protein OXI50_16300 [Gammaproteobacteria bacterium]|nr:hypothetical protein [Gammaproteobacteria bacterium]